MYGIYANIGGILMVNVTIYSIHGSYGYCEFGAFFGGKPWKTMENLGSNGIENQSQCGICFLMWVSCCVVVSNEWYSPKSGWNGVNPSMWGPEDPHARINLRNKSTYNFGGHWSPIVTNENCSSLTILDIGWRYSGKMVRHGDIAVTWAMKNTAVCWAKWVTRTSWFTDDSYDLE